MSNVVTDVVVEVVKALVGSLRGDASTKEVAVIAAQIAERLAPLIVKAVAEELRLHQQTLQLVLALDELDDAAARVLPAMRAAEGSPTVPRLGLDIELVQPATLASFPCGYELPTISNGGVALPSSWSGSYLSPDEAEGLASVLASLAEKARRAG